MSYYAKRFFGQIQREGIVTDGLKLWLDASNPASYPGSGTTWYDLSGNGNNGTMVNGVIPVSNAMQFDGVNDYVDFGSPTSLNIGVGDASFGCYAELTTTASFLGIIGKTSARSWGGRWAILIEENYLYVIFQPNPTYSTTINHINIPVNPYRNNGFHYFFVTINRVGMMTLYIDNSIVSIKNISSLSGLNATSTDKFLAGAYPNNVGTTPPLKGSYGNQKINDIAFYNRALTPDEVNQNFNATRNKYGI